MKNIDNIYILNYMPAYFHHYYFLKLFSWHVKLSTHEN